MPFVDRPLAVFFAEVSALVVLTPTLLRVSLLIMPVSLPDFAGLGMLSFPHVREFVPLLLLGVLSLRFLLVALPPASRQRARVLGVALLDSVLVLLTLLLSVWLRLPSRLLSSVLLRVLSLLVLLWLWCLLVLL